MVLDGIRHFSISGSNSTLSEPNATLLNHLNHHMFRVLAPAVAFLLLLLVVGVVGNILVCYIFFRKMKRNFQNSLLLWLGVFDLICISIGVPSEVYDLRHYYLYPSADLCRSVRFLTTWASLSSTLVLVVIAMDRYRKVCHPLHDQFHQSHIRLVITLIVIISIVISAPTGVVSGHRTFLTNIPNVYGHDCSVRDEYNHGILPIIYEGFLAAAFLFIVLLLIFIYFRIWLEIRRHRHYLMSHSIGGMTFSEMSSDIVHDFINRSEDRPTVRSRLSYLFSSTSKRKRKQRKGNPFQDRGSPRKKDMNPIPGVVDEGGGKEMEDKAGSVVIEECVMARGEDMASLDDSESLKKMSPLQDVDSRVLRPLREITPDETFPKHSPHGSLTMNNVNDNDYIQNDQTHPDQISYNQLRVLNPERNNELEKYANQIFQEPSNHGEHETAFNSESARNLNPIETDKSQLETEQSEKSMLKPFQIETDESQKPMLQPFQLETDQSQKPESARNLNPIETDKSQLETEQSEKSMLKPFQIETDESQKPMLQPFQLETDQSQKPESARNLNPIETDKSQLETEQSEKSMLKPFQIETDESQKPMLQPFQLETDQSQKPESARNLNPIETDKSQLETEQSEKSMLKPFQIETDESQKPMLQPFQLETDQSQKPESARNLNPIETDKSQLETEQSEKSMLKPFQIETDESQKPMLQPFQLETDQSQKPESARNLNPIETDKSQLETEQSEKSMLKPFQIETDESQKPMLQPFQLETDQSQKPESARNLNPIETDKSQLETEQSEKSMLKPFQIETDESQKPMLQPFQLETDQSQKPESARNLNPIETDKSQLETEQSEKSMLKPFQIETDESQKPMLQPFQLETDQSQKPMLEQSQSAHSLAVSTRAKKVQQGYNTKTRRTTVIAFVITLGLILSYLPNLTLILLRSIIHDVEHHFDDTSLIFYNIFLRSYFANNVINVFVYGYMNKIFRTQLKMCCFRSKAP